MTCQVGDACTFYHEGGVGERRWVVGWRYGIVRAVPTRGAKKNWVHVEIPVRQYAEEDDGYRLKPNALAWVHRDCVNRVGDYIFHTEERDARDAELKAEVALRAETKLKDQAKADKKARRK